jgi:hypothetical protein
MRGIPAARSPFIAAAGLVALLAAASLIGERAADEIPVSNWTAPPYWSIPAERQRTTESKSLEAGAIVNPTLAFHAVTPCRIVDTRGFGFTGPYGPPHLTAGAGRSFAVTSPGTNCNIPSGVTAVSFNFAAVNLSANGNLIVYPTGGSAPSVSSLNWTPVEIAISNAAVIALGSDSITVVVNGPVGSTVDVVIDVNGYYAVDPFLHSAGFHNTGIGFGALAANTTGEDNAAFGFGADGNSPGGFYNTAVGSLALGGTTGAANVAVGFTACQSCTHNFNTAVGYGALPAATGSNNVAIGNAAGGAATDGDNDVYLASPGQASESNTIRIGTPGTHNTTFIAGISGSTIGSGTGVLVDGSGHLGTIVSSIRFKEDVRDLGSESERIHLLRPVRFRYKAEIDPDGSDQFGLIAEEVSSVYPELVLCGADGRPWTVKYHLLVPMLLNEVQKDRRELERSRARIEDLQARLERLESLLSTQNR